MREIIIEKLKQIERDHGVTILYACESGSRSWGFESTDSDYDVRYIYVHKPEWYLAVSNKKDTIQEVGKVLDFAGWELKKTLNLMQKSNASLFEKLGSPIYYMGDEGFLSEMRGLTKVYLNPKAIAYHYRNSGKGFLKEYSGEEVPLKKYCYIWRSVLAMKWALDKNEAPPIEFDRLRVLIEGDKINDVLTQYLRVKSMVTESHLVVRDKQMDEFVEEQLREFDDRINQLVLTHTKDTVLLDEALYRYVMRQT